MRKITLTLLTTAAVFLLAGTAVGAELELEDYAGEWTAEGITPDDENFTSTYSVSVLEDGALKVELNTVADGKTYTSEGTIRPVGAGGFELRGSYNGDSRLTASSVDDGRPGLYFVGTRSKAEWSTPWRMYLGPVEDGGFRLHVEQVRDGQWEDFFIADYTGAASAAAEAESSRPESD